MTKRIAVFPGSFDPVTKGHENIVLRGAQIFDEIIVAIGENSQKKYMFTLEKRLTFLKQSFGHLENVRIESYEGLTTEYCVKNKAQFMLRGLRSSVDFEYERSIAQMSHDLNGAIETVLLYTSPEFSAINSSVVREIIKNNGNVDKFVPHRIQIS